MMHAIFLSLLVLSVIGHSFSNAQEVTVPQLSYQEFYQRLYPLSDSQQFEYQNAARELNASPTSKPALARLSKLANAGFMPACHDLIEAKFATNDAEASQQLSTQGARQGDPGCAITLATMYKQWSKPTVEADEQELQRCQHYAYGAEQLLRDARTKRFIHDPETKKQIATYENQEAQTVLRNLLAEKQTEFEKTVTKQELKKYEKSLNTSLNDIPLACFVIKENIAKGTHEPVKSALGLAEKIISHEVFDADYLYAAGVRSAIEKLTEHENQKIKERAVKICSQWDDAESRVGKFQLAPCAADKLIKEKFVSPQYSPEILEELIERADTVYQGEDLVDAALYLHMHRTKNSDVINGVKKCLNRALTFPDPLVRRAIIDKCKVADGELYWYWADALYKYAKELSDQDGLLQEEADYIKKQLNWIFEKTKDDASGDMALTAYTLLKRHPRCFPDISEEQNQQLQGECYKKAFNAGNYAAICMVLPKMRLEPQPQNTEEFSRAMIFWSQAGKSAAKEQQSSLRRSIDPVELNREVRQKIQELLVSKKELGETKEDVAFYYRAAVALAPTDGVAALEAFQKALHVVFLTPNDGEVKRKLYESTGMKAVLEEEAQRGQGWAYSAQAYYIYLAALNPGYHLDSRIHAASVIKAIEQARALLQQAAAAQVPHTDFAPLDEVDLEVKKGTAYCELYNGDSNQLYLQKAFELFESAIQKRSSLGMYNWALLTLNGHREKGQTALEKSINYLIEATQNNCTSAEELLKTISAKGMLYVARCGGTMTSELKSKINACLGSRNTNPAADQSAVTQMSTMDPADEYRITLERANEGNVEAMVNLALLLKEGRGVAQSDQLACERFADALFASDGSPSLGGATAIAFAGLAESALTNVRAQMARCKASMDFFKQPKILAKNPYLCDELCQEFKKLHTLMADPIHAPEAELLYSTGLATAIQDCFENYSCHNVFAYTVLDGYMQRIAAFPQEVKERAELLRAPIKFLIKRTEDLFTMRFDTILMNEFDSQALNAAIASLTTVIDKKLWDYNQDELRYLKGMLQFLRASSLRERVISNETKAIFGELATRGHKGARYMRAYIAARDNAERDRGIALFEELAAQKDLRSLFALVEIANVKDLKNSKERLEKATKMQDYLNRILAIDPDNTNAHNILVGLYVNNPKLKPVHLKGSSEKECAEYIISLLPKTKGLKGIMDSYKIILRVRKQEYSPQLLDDLRALLNTCEDSGPAHDTAFAALKESYEKYNLNNMIDQWAQDYIALEKQKDKPNAACIARIYETMGWLHALMTRTFGVESMGIRDEVDVLSRAMNGDILVALTAKDTFQKVKEKFATVSARLQEAKERFLDCFKASMTSGKSTSLMYFLKSHLDLMSKKSNSEKLAICRATIINGMREMKTQKLQWSDVPLFQECLNDYVLYAQKHGTQQEFVVAQKCAEIYRAEFNAPKEG